MRIRGGEFITAPLMAVENLLDGKYQFEEHRRRMKIVSASAGSLSAFAGAIFSAYNDWSTWVTLIMLAVCAILAGITKFQHNQTRFANSESQTPRLAISDVDG